MHSNVRRNCETFLIDSELSEVIDEMENIRENTRVRKSVMDTREQLEHGCAKSFRDRGAIYTRETKTLTGESKFRIGSSNVCDVNERFDTWSRKSLVKMEQKFETRIETRPEIFFSLFSLFLLPPSFNSNDARVARLILTIPFVRSLLLASNWPENTVFHHSLSPLGAGRREQ